MQSLELFSNPKTFIKFYSYLLLFLGIDIDNNIGAILEIKILSDPGEIQFYICNES